jgi:hypothetical protein
MKPKKLPDDLYDWLKTKTFEIGAVTWLTSDSRRCVPRAGDDRSEPDRKSFAKPAGIRKRDQARAELKTRRPKSALICDANRPMTPAQRFRP